MTDLLHYTPARIAVKVKPRIERQIRKEHPWIYDQAIIKQSKEGQAGDLAIIYDQKRNKFLALGLLDPYSPIRIKLIQFKRPASIDAAWFQQKIEAAYALRQPLFETDTNSYRLIYGENDGLPGMIADVYDQVLVLKLYSFIWWPYLETVLPILQAIARAKAVVLRLSRNLQQHPDQLSGFADGQVIRGQLANEEVLFREHGLRFVAHVIKGHKTGYFLDHRHNRFRVQGLAKGKSVLDVFAYAGGFSVHALAGGAKEVTSLDISTQALTMAQRNAALNAAPGTHRVLSGDAFQLMEDMIFKKEQFDLIIIDPPSFAKRESEREKALVAYRRLVQLGAQLVTPKGMLVMASCSSRITAEEFFQVVTTTLAKSARPFQELERTFHDIDHPIRFPEGAYLKCGYYRID